MKTFLILTMTFAIIFATVMQDLHLSLMLIALILYIIAYNLILISDNTEKIMVIQTIKACKVLKIKSKKSKK